MLLRLYISIMCIFAAVSSTYGRSFATDVKSYYNQTSVLSTKALLEKGDSLSRKANEPDSAIVCYTVVVNRYRSPRNDKEYADLAQAWHGMWYSYFFLFFDYAKSKECLVNYMKLCEKMGTDLSRSYLMQGAMYEAMAEQMADDSLEVEAAKYYRRAIDIAGKNHNNEILINAFTNLVSLCSGKKALYNIGKEFGAMKAIEKEAKDNFYYRFAMLTYRYSVMELHGRYREALALNEKLIGIIPEGIVYMRHFLFAHVSRCQLYRKDGQYGRSIDEAMLVAKLSEQHDIKDGMILAYTELSKTYAKMNDSGKADEFRFKKLALKDSLLNFRQMASVREMGFLQDMKEVEEQLNDMEKTRRIWVVLTVVTAIIASIVIASLVIVRRKNRRLHETNESLYEKYQEMLARDEEKARERKKVPHSLLSPSAKEEMMTQIKMTVEQTDDIFSSDFTIDRLAELAGLKSKAVSQVINESTASNFNAFVNEYRIKEACKRMNDVDTYGNLTIEAIGNSVGFKSRNSFIASFKKFTGLTPSEYKHIAKGKLRIEN